MILWMHRFDQNSNVINNYTPLVAQPKIFRLFMKGKFEAYVLHRELEQMEPIMNFQVLPEGLELEILLNHHKQKINHGSHTKMFLY